MSMTVEAKKEQIKKNLAKLDQLKGEGIIQSIKRSMTNNNDRYLIVGLGGTGCNALYETKRILSERVDAKALAANVRFLAIDSAGDDIAKLVKDGLFDRNETVLLPHIGARDRLSNPTPAMRSWLNPRLKENLENGLDGTGAGNRRQLGRVLLCSDAAVAELRTKVEKAFGDIVLDGSGVQCNLIVLSGIAGGTGSGTVIDATYIISQVLANCGRTNFFKNSYGFIFLPPASSNEFRPAQGMGLTQGNSNGYAALKEIEYHMTIEDRGELYKMQYDSLPVTQDNLFEYCFLIDGNRTDTLYSEPKDVAARTAADCIVSIIASEQSQQGVGAAGGGVGAQTVSLLSSLSNVAAQVETFLASTDQLSVPRDSYYKFNATGYSECWVPTDLLTVYAFKKVFDHMYELYRQGANVDRAEAIRVLGELGLNSKEGLLARIDRKVRVGLLPSKAKLQDAVFDAEQELQTEMEAEFDGKMDVLFNQRGPFYLINLTKEATDILRGRSTEQTTDKGKRAYERESIGRILGNLANLSAKANSETWEVYCAFIDELKRILDANGAVITETLVTEDSYKKSYRWSPVGYSPEMSRKRAGLEWLDSLFGEDRMKKVINAFQSKLLQKRREWCDLSVSREFNGSDFIRDFVEDAFKDILEMDVEDFVAKCYSGDSDAFARKPDNNEEASDELKTAAEAIAMRLCDHGSVLAQMRNAPRFAAAPKSYALIMPSSTTLLNGLVENSLRGLTGSTGTGSGGLSVYVSENSQSFTLLTNNSALPLEEFAWVADGEQAYAATAGASVIGRHLFEAEVNWQSLPNLINQAHWDEVQPGYRFEDEAVLSDYMRQMLDSAREFGLVEDFDMQSWQYPVKVMDDSEGSALSRAPVSYTIMNGSVATDPKAMQVYAAEAEKLFVDLDNQSIINIDELTQLLPTSAFIQKNTKPSSMKINDKDAPDDAKKWEYAGRFIRKMYATSVSLERTLGVLAELRRLVEESNAQIVDATIKDQRKRGFPNNYGLGYIEFEETSSSTWEWKYKDEDSYWHTLLMDSDLEGWQKPYHYYFMMKRYIELEESLFAHWQEKASELNEDAQNRDRSNIRKEAMGKVFITVSESIESKSTSFARELNALQSDESLPKEIADFYKEAITSFRTMY